MGLETETLEFLCELVVDCPHSTPKWTDSGTIVLRNQNIRNGVLDLSTPSFTNEEDYQKRIKRAVPQAGDIVFTREAPMGEVCLIPEGLKCCLGQRQVLLRPRNDVCGEYLFWALQSPYVQHQISWNEGTGTTVSNVRIPVLKALIIPRYPETERQSAQILSTLAKKIELNTQTNQTLEQMAQTLFKSWFVDFDPVFDNALLKAGVTTQEPHNNADVQQLLVNFPEALRSKAKQRLDVLRSRTTTHEVTQEPHNNEGQKLGNEAFPSEFEFNEQLGWIPKGWVVSELSELINIKHGFAYKGEFFSDEKTENILLTPGNVNVGGGFKSAKYKYYNGPIVNEYIFKEGDMYVNMTDLSKASDTLGYPAIVPQIHGITFHHNQRLGKVIYKENKSAKKEFIYQLLCSHKSRNNVLGSATGTTVKHTSPTKILSLSICHSGGNVESIFESYAKALYEKSAANNLSNIALTKLRDTLLPKLISGELQIPDTKLSASSFPNNA